MSTDSCLSLQKSDLCPAFQKYQFDTSIVNFYNDTKKDITILDRNIQNFIDITSVDQIVSEFQCKKEDVVNRKYLKTFTCAVLVSKSVPKCNSPANYLCKSVCDTYIQSILDILQNCSPNANQTQQLKSYCSSNMFNSDSNCINGEMNNEQLSATPVAAGGWKNEYLAIIVFGIALITLIIVVIMRCGKSKTKMAKVPISNRSPRNMAPKESLPINESVAYSSSKQSQSFYSNPSSYRSEPEVSNRVSSQLNRRTTSTNSTVSSVLDKEIISLLIKSQHHYKCIREYTPTMEDEVEIAIGDILVVSHQYDDGWAYGVNLNTGGLGVLPLSYIVPTTINTNVKVRESVYGSKKRLDKIKKIRSTYTSSAGTNKSDEERYSDAFSTYSSSAYTTTTKNGDSIYTSTTYQPPSKQQKYQSEYTEATGYTGVTEDSNYTMDSGLSEDIRNDINTLNKHK